MSINPSTPLSLTLTLKEFAGGLASAVVAGALLMQGVVWWNTASLKDDVGILKTDMSSVKTDIAAVKGDISPIKTAVTNLQGADRDNVIRLNDTAQRIDGQLSALAVQMTQLSGKLDVTNQNLGFVNRRIDDLRPPPPQRPEPLKQ